MALLGRTRDGIEIARLFRVRCLQVMLLIVIGQAGLRAETSELWLLDFHPPAHHFNIFFHKGNEPIRVEIIVSEIGDLSKLKKADINISSWGRIAVPARDPSQEVFPPKFFSGREKLIELVHRKYPDAKNIRVTYAGFATMFRLREFVIAPEKTTQSLVLSSDRIHEPKSNEFIFMDTKILVSESGEVLDSAYSRYVGLGFNSQTRIRDIQFYDQTKIKQIPLEQEGPFPILDDLVPGTNLLQAFPKLGSELLKIKSLPRFGVRDIYQEHGIGAVCIVALYSLRKRLGLLRDD